MTISASELDRSNTVGETEYDVVVVGAGFAGMYALHRFRDQMGLSVRVYEKGDDVGGTWYWNRYPGARCDADTTYYSYSFSDSIQQEWTWSEKFATQPELLRYAQFVADRLDLRRDISFNTAVAAAAWDDATGRWNITVNDGSVVRSRYFVTAVGCLSAAQTPNFAGLSTFEGEIYHTGDWPHEPVDFSGKRVAVIGTGSSGIQAIPAIAKEASSLTVFQRTPHFSAPARNRPVTADEDAATKKYYRQLREAAKATPGGAAMPPPAGNGVELTPEERDVELWRRWVQGGSGFVSAFRDAMVNEESNAFAADFIRGRIRDTVEDPEVAEMLVPHGYPVGTKRLALDTGYYATFNLPHVSLVSVKDNPIERFTSRGIVVAGREYEADIIVLATGYDAMTGPYLRMNISGREGMPLSEKWAAGPTTYLGLATSGFPNLFMITAPGSPSVLTNVVSSIEQHVEWISDFIAELERTGGSPVEPSIEAENAWVTEVNEIAAGTLFPKAASWYMGANVPGKPQIFMPYAGGLHTYRAICDRIAANDYEGFVRSNVPAMAH